MTPRLSSDNPIIRQVQEASMRAQAETNIMMEQNAQWLQEMRLTASRDQQLEATQLAAENTERVVTSIEAMHSSLQIVADLTTTNVSLTEKALEEAARQTEQAKAAEKRAVRMQWWSISVTAVAAVATVASVVATFITLAQ